MASPKIIPCLSNKLFAILDCTTLVLVQLFQACVLNYYAIDYLKYNHTSYFWFLGDFIISGLFVTSIVKAYIYLQRNKREKKDDTHPVTQESCLKPFVGVLPLCYVSWIVYSSYLVAKISYIFKKEIINSLKPQDIFGPQLLKFSISTSTIIFILLVAGHHDAEQQSFRNLQIKTLSTNTAFELLDSVSFLSILIIQESHLIVSFEFENVVLLFACLNYMLPTIPLYQLSLTDFNQKEKPISIEGIYRLCHLLLTNVPYLAVRIYLWTGYGSDISIFIMKNIIAIVWQLKDIIPMIIMLCKRFLSKGSPKSAKEENDIVELHAME